MITRIYVKNFRGITERTFNFKNGASAIQGPNEAGKTTIKEAIVFGLFGVDSYATKNPNHLIQDTATQTTVVIETDKAVFERRKKTGAPSDVKFNRLGHPQVSMTQTELTAMLGMEVEEFLSMFNVGYFMRLPEDKQKVVLAKTFQVDRASVFANMVPGYVLPKAVDLNNLKASITFCEKERRALNNSIQSLQGSLNTSREQLTRIEGMVGAQYTPEDEAKLNSLSACEELSAQYERDLTRYNHLTTEVTRKEEELKSIDAELKTLNLQLSALVAVTMPDAEKLKEIENDNQKKADAILNKKLPKPQFTALRVVDEDNCNRCGQRVIESVKARMKADADQALITFNNLEREVVTTNMALDDQLKSLSDELTKVRSQFSSRVSEFNRYSDQKNLLTSKIEANVKRMRAVQIPNLTGAPEKPQFPDGWKETLQNLRTARHAYTSVKSEKTLLTSKIEQLEKEIAEKSEQHRKISVLEETLKKLPDAELMALSHQLVVPGLNIKPKEGGIEVRDTRGIPYQSLSDGRKMKADLALSALFQSKHKRAPHFYFVDNADLVDRFEGFPSGQVFLAEVKDDLKEVQIISL